jgi:uncharacterized membrane protein YeaQ/YmgE (transglycosylase-associated protein family)
MSLLLALIIGAIVGWLGARIAGREEGIIASIFIGIVGAIIGGALYSLVNSGSQSYFLFSWAGFFWSLIGSIIFAFILNAFWSRPHHTV